MTEITCLYNDGNKNKIQKDERNLRLFLFFLDTQRLTICHLNTAKKAECVSYLTNIHKLQLISVYLQHRLIAIYTKKSKNNHF